MKNIYFVILLTLLLIAGCQKEAKTTSDPSLKTVIVRMIITSKQKVKIYIAEGCDPNNNAENFKDRKYISKTSKMVYDFVFKGDGKSWEPCLYGLYYEQPNHSISSIGVGPWGFYTKNVKSGIINYFPYQPKKMTPDVFSKNPKIDTVLIPVRLHLKTLE